MLSVRSELDAVGVAQVIVVPSARVGRKRDASSLKGQLATKAFKSSERSIASAILRTASSSSSEAQTAGFATEFQEYKNLGVILGFVDHNGMNELVAAQHGGLVEEVVLAPQFSLIKPERNEPFVPGAAAALQESWGLAALDVPALWDKGLTGRGVLVGHLDTGVNANHPALHGAVAHFAEFNRLGVQIPEAAPRDSDTHGTHSAATIAGRPVHGYRIGVAPGASLASAMVIEGGNVIARVLAGLDWIIERGARVVSLSLGFRGFMTDFIPIVRILRESGILPVMAIGNEGPGTSRSPGNYVESLSVGAMDKARRIATFSGSQLFERALKPEVPDVVAPGVDILSADGLSTGYRVMDGTSMATPHIAGLAALLLEAHPAATVEQLETAIFASCVEIHHPRSERTGRGLPSATQALDALTQAMQAAQAAGGP